MKRIVLAILFVLAATMSGMPACSDLFFPSCAYEFTPYARERLESPFERLENRDPD
jgi:hypothetical protein